MKVECQAIRVLTLCVISVTGLILPCAPALGAVFDGLASNREDKDVRLILPARNRPERSNLVSRPQRTLFVPLKLSELEPHTIEVAKQLEIWPYIQEVDSSLSTMSEERKTFIRHKIMDTVFEAFFDAASLEAEAEREKALLEALRRRLSERRDKGIDTNNAINFMTSGTLNTIGSVLGFTNNISPFPGNFAQMMSGVVSTGMSMYALKQDAGPRSTNPGRSTVVAALFGRPVDEHTDYPESVWRFFHGPSTEKPGMSRVEVLEANWIERDWLEKPGSKRDKMKIDFVCGVPIKEKIITLDDITDQINIIADISSSASLMGHHLRDLMRVVDTDDFKEYMRSGAK